jgi:hypothetical protein
MRTSVPRSSPSWTSRATEVGGAIEGISQRCKGKANMRKTVPLQEVADDLYTHDILEYKLGEIYTISNNRISTIPI